MIRDLEIMKDITPLFQKKIIIWGMGGCGHRILRALRGMGAGEKGIILCDSNKEKWGCKEDDREIISPKTLQRRISSDSISKMILCIAVEKVSLQNEILDMLDSMNLMELTVYTQYAVEWGIYLNVNNPYVNASYRNEMLIEHERKRITYDENWMFQDMHHFAYAPLHNDEMILVYQSGKVGSMSVYKSIEKYGKYVLHTHKLSGLEYRKNNTLLDLLRLKSAKMISLVREPLSRQISVMWENIPNVNRYSAAVDFKEIEGFYFKEDFEYEGFEWFIEEMESVFDIDIYEYPFDKEAGYSIIKKNNMEVLLIKMEKLKGLEDVIGSFLGIPDFALENRNIAGEKAYRFAYKEYLEDFSMSKDRLKHIYYENKYMRYFYTDEEIDGFYSKWIQQCHNGD